MKLTAEMIKTFDLCPMMYKRMFVDRQEQIPTIKDMQNRWIHVAMMDDIKKRANGGPGSTVDEMMEVYDSTREHDILELEYMAFPKNGALFRNMATAHFGQYLRHEAPLLKPTDTGLTISRKLDENLELEMPLDAMLSNEILHVMLCYWKVGRRMVLNDFDMLMASLITGIQNVVLIQFIFRISNAPRRYNVFIRPEQMVWFERIVRTISESISKGAFHACMPFRGICTKVCCPFYMSCRGAVE